MKLENFVPFPRQIASDFKNGLMSRNEFLLYSWLRVNLNPYGVASTSLGVLREDIFKDVSENYINKLLLSLRSKKYIYYHDRQGRRGSFEVHMGNLKLPDGQIRMLDKFFSLKEVRSKGETQEGVPAEASKPIGSASQKLEDMKSQLGQLFSVGSESPSVRSHYNDNEIENENKISIEKTSFKGTPVKTFEPNTSETMRCYEIAKDLGEKDMNFILSILQAHGLPIIERAWSLYKEKAATSKIDNPAAYFNGIVTQVTKLN